MKAKTKESPSRQPGKTVRAAVRRLEQAQSALLAFRTENPELMEELSELIGDHNATLAEAIAAAKAELGASDEKSLTCGPIGVQKRGSGSWNGAMLWKLVPRSKSREFLSKRVVYDVDAKVLEQMIRQNDLDTKVMKAYEEGTPTLAVMPMCPKELKI